MRDVLHRVGFPAVRGVALLGGQVPPGHEAGVAVEEVVVGAVRLVAQRRHTRGDGHGALQEQERDVVRVRALAAPVQRGHLDGHHVADLHVRREGVVGEAVLAVRPEHRHEPGGGLRCEVRFGEDAPPRWAEITT